MYIVCKTARQPFSLVLIGVLLCRAPSTLIRSFLLLSGTYSTTAIACIMMFVDFDPNMETLTPKQSAPIPRQSLSAAVVERLTEKILSGELREGEQLRQDAIATEFQISRIPVREALSHLAAEGLITIVANRGAVVSALSPSEIMELFETRAVMECYMLRCALPNMKEEDFQHAEDILRQYEQSLEKDSEVKSWGRWNWSFHSALYAAAKQIGRASCRDSVWVMAD